MKFLAIGDLHGNMPKVYYKDVDAILAPGDFCSDAPRKYMFKALKMYLKDPNSDVDWCDLVGKREARKMVKKSLADGRKILEYLNSLGLPVYLVPGNWDWTAEKRHDWKFLHENFYRTTLIKGLKNLKDIYHKRVKIDGFDLIGHGITAGPEFPQDKATLKRLGEKRVKQLKKKYEKKKEKLSKLFRSTSQAVLFMSHNVPYNTKLDLITDKKSPRYGWHFGSSIARDMINKHQPLLCLGGHMHEHFGKCKVGKTTVVNAGFGSHVNVFMDIQKNKIKKMEFKYKGKVVKGYRKGN